MIADEPAVHYYISPHFDDAVLSCGGRIWLQTQAGADVVVITVFGRVPEAGIPLSPYAQELHTRWGCAVEAVRQRPAEDIEALACLGAKPMHWSYLDCIYRTTAGGDFPYASEDALWGPVHASDSGLFRELADRMAALPLRPAARLYSPLGVGRHVDHRIVRRAAEASGHPLTYYEDFPYARDLEALEAARTPGASKPELVPLSGRALEAKVDAIACYRSQISTFWSSRDEMGATVRAYAVRIGGGEPAERYWRPAGA